MTKKQDQAGHENSLMKKVKIKNEFINEVEKTRKSLKKEFKKRMVNNMVKKNIPKIVKIS